MTERDDDIAVRTSDGIERVYDLVVGCDGLRSDMRRRLALDGAPYDTGWACWTWWAPRHGLAPCTVLECWGAGRLLGIYPSPRGLGVVACAPSSALEPTPPGDRAARLRALFPGMRGYAAEALATCPEDGVYLWRLDDHTARSWSRGRVTLAGDAACGFLPTAGIGASMALESSLVLAQELRRSGAGDVPGALARYEARRRPRCETAQRDSRRLARLMFLENRLLSTLRGFALRLARPQDLIANIIRMAEDPI